MKGQKWLDLGGPRSSISYFSLKRIILLHAETPAVTAGVSLKGEQPDTVQMGRVNKTL